MAVKLIKVAFKKDMIKVNDNGKEMWYNCDKAAKGYAKTAFQEAVCNKENVVLQEGSEVELVKERRNIEGQDVDFVTQVRKPGQGSYTPPASTGASAPVSSPQAATPAFKPSYGAKTPEESEKITRLSIMSTAANAAQALTGQIQDPNVLGDVIVALYVKFLAEIKK